MSKQCSYSYSYRSCVKKILEHDDNPSRCMVLMISELVSDVTRGSCDITDRSHDHNEVK